MLGSGRVAPIFPAKGREATIAGGWTRIGPEIVISDGFLTGYFKICQTERFGIIFFEIIARSQSAIGQFLFIVDEPIFHLVYIGHFRMVIF